MLSLFEVNKMTAELANFIKQNIDLINESEFDQLYQQITKESVKTAELTEMLLDSDIDFLSFMTKVPEGCFAKIKSLTSITIPESIQLIEDKAFSWCSNLESVKLANSITRIGEGAFYLCTSLKNIDLPSNLTSLKSFVFSKCNSLRSIVIPASVVSVYSFAFKECENLTSVTFEEGSICKTINDSVFKGCKKLKTVNLPDSLETLGLETFYGCESLEDITIGPNVKMVYSSTFSNCTNLKNITIQGSITAFTDSMFATNKQLQTININIPRKEFIARFGSKQWYQELKKRGTVTINCVDGTMK